MPDNVGRIIAGRYFLEEPIGQGGMGIVWRAHDQVLHRQVAVKEVMLPAAMGDDEAAAYQRTLREARTVAKLNHPNIVTVHDVAEEDGRLWIVMELIPSGSLEERVAAYGPMTALRAARLGQQLLSALAAVHAAGVLHRDVKPSNVLIAAGDPGDGLDEWAVLTDFGIAQSEGDSRITQGNMVMGSAGYTAPERLTGQDATPAADLWSLGATLYAAVEGHGPYQRDTASSMLTATAHEAPPPAPSAGRLAPLIEALLRRDPSARPSAAVAARILTQILRQMPDETAPASFVAANWVDLTPAGSALYEIPEPAEWAEPEQYDTPLPAPPDELTQPSPLAPLQSPVRPSPSISASPAAPDQPQTADQLPDQPQTADQLFARLVAETGGARRRPGRRVRAPGAANRARAVVLTVPVVIVIAALIAGSFWLLRRPPRADTLNRSSATASATSTTTTATPTATPTKLPPMTPGATVVGAIDKHSSALPPGYKTETVPASRAGKTAGFSIDIPQRWQLQLMGQQTYEYTPDKGVTYVEIDLTKHVLSSMVAEAQYLAAQDRSSVYHGYQRIYGSSDQPQKPYIQAEPILQTAGALWQFDWVQNGVKMRVDELLFDLGQQSYTITMTAPAGSDDRNWNGHVIATVATMLHTFRPLA